MHSNVQFFQHHMKLPQFRICKKIKITIRNFCHKIKYKHYKKSSFGIVCHGNTLKSISKKAFIEINGLMNFNFKASSSPRNNYEVGRINIGDGAYLIIGKNVNFHAGCKIDVLNNSKLTIGNNVYFNLNTTLCCRDCIKIGDNCAISQNCVIRDSDVHQIQGVINHSPISIGNHVWIGTNVIILKGVTIGDNCVIGAGSVVTRNIPKNSVAAGNPAKVIKENIVWKN